MSRAAGTDYAEVDPTNTTLAVGASITVTINFDPSTIGNAQRCRDRHGERRAQSVRHRQSHRRGAGRDLQSVDDLESTSAPFRSAALPNRR
jgi:hypothetical protein